MTSIKRLIFPDLSRLIPVSQIDFIPGDRTIQVKTQGKLITVDSLPDHYTESEKGAQKLIQQWSSEIYGIGD